MTLVTVMAVVIAINKDTMWGITIKEWQELHPKRKLSFSVYLFWTIIISVAMLVITAFCSTCWILIIVLCIILCILSISYIRNELPLLLRSEEAFAKIYRRRLLYQEKIKSNIEKAKSNNRTSWNEEKFSRNLNRITVFLIFSKGLGRTLEIQIGDNEDEQRKAKRLNELFDIQNYEMSKLSEKSAKLIEIDFKNQNETITLGEMYNLAFENIKWALSFGESCDITKLLDSDAYYQITRTLFALSRIEYGLFTNLNDDFKKIFTRCLYTLNSDANEKGDNIAFANKTFLSCLVYALDDEKYKVFIDAIIEALKENLWILSSDKETSQVFIMITSFYLYYLDVIFMHTTAYAKKTVKRFLEEVHSDSFFNSTWRSKLQGVANAVVIKSTHNPVSLEKILNYVEFFQRLLIRSGAGSVDTLFSTTNVIDWYFEVFAHELYDEEFIDTVVGKNEKLKHDVSSVLQKKWYGHKETLTSGKNINQGRNSVWLKEKLPVRNYFDLYDVTPFYSSIEKSLSLFLEKVYSQEIDRASETTIPKTDEELDKVSKQLIEALYSVRTNNDGSNNLFYNNTISLSREKWFEMNSYIDLPLPRDGYYFMTDMFKMNIQNFEASLIHMMQEEIIGRVIITKPVDEIKGWVQESKAQYTSSGYRWHDKIAQLELEIVSNPILRPNLIWVDGAIKFNIEIDKKLTKILRLTDEQISDIIQRYYTREDGRYAYNYSGVQVFLNRDELLEIIRKTCYIIRAVFRYSIVTDENKIIKF